MDNRINYRVEVIAQKLGRHSQSHLLRFINQLDESKKERLLEDIEGLDLDLLDDLVERYVRGVSEIKLSAEIMPADVYPACCPEPLRKKYRKAYDFGRNLIAAGKIAAFTVAGGQGTRLNYDGPKGNFPATPLRRKSLFQVFAEGIIATQRRYGCTVAWYIMTSPTNHQETIRIFQDYDYFGLDPQNIMFFPQGMMPSFDMRGKILLSEPHRLAMSPDGHGGSLRALYKSGALADMAQRGVEQISYFQVDNPQVYVIDPLFIGLHGLDGAQMSSKAVTKAGPLERVGNFTLVDGRVTVIEYSDLPDELAQKQNQDSRLAFEYGSIAVHIISRIFVEKLNQRGFSLPWHRAVKKVPFIDESGCLVEPDEPNAVKLENFVFDALPLAEKSIILEVDRPEQFAPIKNATGADSPASSMRLQIERAARWLTAAGVNVPRKPDGTVDAIIEISPLFALNAEELCEKGGQLPTVKPGDKVYLG